MLVVTGGAGFIGSNLVDRLIEEDEVLVLDNLSSGKLENLENAKKSKNFKFSLFDISSNETGKLSSFFEGATTIFHFAANPIVYSNDPKNFMDNNLIATFNVLEAMRKKDVPLIVFASSSAVYGEAKKLPTPEDYPTLPISLYGATKLSSESLIASYAYTYGIKGIILRMANIVGPRSTHGIVYDFVGKLKKNPKELEILGDGSQRKSYLYISDTLDAILKVWKDPEANSQKVGIFNVGNFDTIGVSEIADIVIKKMNLKGVNKKFVQKVEEGRGWKGDVKYMHLDISRIRSIGWRPRLNSAQAIEKCASDILAAI